jgi:hypothetical protein
LDWRSYPSFSMKAARQTTANIAENTTLMRVGSAALDASARDSSRPSLPIPYAAAEPRNNNPGRPEGAYNDSPTAKMIADKPASKSCVG